MSDEDAYFAAAGAEFSSEPLAIVSSDVREVTRGWGELLVSANIRGAARQLADNCEIASSSESRLDLVLADDKQHLFTEQIRKRLEDGISSHLGTRISVKVTPGSPPRNTPAEIRIANENERMREAREAIEHDPTVRAMQSAFGAVVEADSVQPIDDQ